MQGLTALIRASDDFAYGWKRRRILARIESRLGGD